MKFRILTLACALLTLVTFTGCGDDGTSSNSFQVGEQCTEDACGVCDTDPTNNCVEDCAGEWGGDAVEDSCGTCDADPSNDCVEDCAGTFGGDAVEDNCGTCDADPANDCTADCNGDLDGDAVEDMCGVCDNDPSNDCVEDCAGEWGGTAYEDMCQVCDSDPGTDCIQDCAGEWGGNAYEDACGTCDADPSNDCIDDCNGVAGGDSQIDQCGVCDNDPANDCVQDCNGNWGGTDVLDNCGVCDSDPSNDCTDDCAGVAGGAATVDLCGVCVGGTTGRASTCATAVATLEADSYVRESSASTNYGSATDLMVAPNWRGNNQLRQTYLRFDLSALPVNSIVVGATLKMVSTGGYANGGDGNVYTYPVADDSWGEGTINWTNRPTADVSGNLGFWWIWNNFTPKEEAGLNSSQALADHVRDEFFGDKKVSLMLSSNGYETEYYSKESGVAGKIPQLEILYMQGQSTEIQAEADTFVANSSPMTNYGSDATYTVDPPWNGPTQEKNAFVRFDLASIPSNAVIQRVTLTMTARAGYAYGGNGNVYTYGFSDDTWDESTLTWANKPAVDTTAHMGYWWLWYNTTPVDQIGINSSAVLREFVRNEFTTDGKVSVMLRSAGYRTIYYSTENTAAAKRPTLRIDYTLP